MPTIPRSKSPQLWKLIRTVKAPFASRTIATASTPSLTRVRAGIVNTRFVALIFSFLAILSPHVTKGASSSVNAPETQLRAERVNLALGVPYWINQGPDNAYPDTGRELTDGIKGGTNYGDRAWQGHLRNDFRVVTLDLGAPKPIDEINVGFLFEPAANIRLPSEVIVYTSENGLDWSEPRRISSALIGTPVRTTRQAYPFTRLDRTARYVRVVFYTAFWTFIDEIEVWGEDRVVTVEGPTDLLDLNDPFLGLTAGHSLIELRPDRLPNHDIGSYMAAGTPDVGGARHMMLIYTHQDWTLADALPYVAYGRRDLESATIKPPQWADWFFDTFLFLALRTPSGYAFDAPSRGTPATWKEWTWFLDFLFAPNKQLAAFDEAVAHAKRSIDDPNYKAKVVVMIPYPMPDTVGFGDPTGRGIPLNFSPFPQRYPAAMDDRVIAINAYLDEFFARWNAHQYEHLELIGLYWLAENVPGPTDFELTQKVAPLVKERDMRFFWIPYYNAAGWAHWAELGFDGVMYQPNYMFNASVPLSRFKDVTDGARRYGMGIEIEADGTVLYSNQGRNRYYSYLNAGVEYGFMNEALHGYYQDVSVLGQAFASNDPVVRKVYEATYQYVKGIYVPEE